MSFTAVATGVATGSSFEAAAATAGAATGAAAAAAPAEWFCCAATVARVGAAPCCVSMFSMYRGAAHTHIHTHTFIHTHNNGETCAHARYRQYLASCPPTRPQPCLMATPQASGKTGSCCIPHTTTCHVPRVSRARSFIFAFILLPTDCGGAGAGAGAGAATGTGVATGTEVMTCAGADSTFPPASTGGASGSAARARRSLSAAIASTISGVSPSARRHTT